MQRGSERRRQTEMMRETERETDREIEEIKDGET